MYVPMQDIDDIFPILGDVGDVVAAIYEVT
jgi:hypothetical protein